MDAWSQGAAPTYTYNSLAGEIKHDPLHTPQKISRAGGAFALQVTGPDSVLAPHLVP